MLDCARCPSTLPPGANFCPDCGTTTRTQRCGKCREPMPADAAFCPECGWRTDLPAQLNELLDSARVAYLEKDVETLAKIREVVPPDAPGADKLVDWHDELTQRERFETREDFRRRMASALEESDAITLVGLREEACNDPELAQLADYLVELEQLRRNRDAAEEEADSAELSWGWYLTIFLLACIPFPLGFWMVSTMARIQRDGWPPLKVRTLRRYALVTGSGIACMQVMTLGIWLLSG